MEANVKEEAPDQEQMVADHDERAEAAPNNPTDHSDEGEYVTDDGQDEAVQPSVEKQSTQAEAAGSPMETAEKTKAKAVGQNNSGMGSKVEDRLAEDRAEDPLGASDRPNVEVRLSKTNCTFCGLYVKGDSALGMHEAGHSADGCVCSLCGVAKRDANQRNAHERQVHSFYREENDKQRKEAIRLGQEEIAELKAVGTNIDDVQSKAVESAADWEVEQLFAIGILTKCSICGLGQEPQRLKQHEESHAVVGAVCSLCGVQKSDVWRRNTHEVEAHEFHRSERDKMRTEAIRLTQEELQHLENIGKNIDVVQNEAVESWATLSADELLATGVVQTECLICGQRRNNRHFNKHVQSHSAQGPVCSLCGIHKSNTESRNAHERMVHGFRRCEYDLHRTEAIRLTADEIEGLEAVGTNIAVVQGEAVDSYANAPAGFLATAGFPCRVCGIKLPQYNLERHEPSHSGVGFECSVCGLRKDDYNWRNSHERANHEFYRNEEDKKIEQAVQIPPEELSHLKNLGMNLKKVQRRALPSGASAGSSSGAHRRPTIAVDDSARPSPSNWSSRKRAAAEELLFDESYNTQPAHSAATPNSRPIAFRRAQPAAQQAAAAPIDQTGGKPRAQLVMEALFRRPELVYYDHHDLSAEFKTLPIGSWKNSADCSLLLVRSATPELSGGLQLPAASFSVLLTDRPGHVVCFAKPHGKATAERLRLQLQPAVSFAQLMAAVDRSGVPSALVIANNFGMSTALLPLMVFLIVKKSDMMKRYRWYLLNTIVFCYAYHFIPCANQITAFYPSYCFMFDPIVPISKSGSIFSFYVAFFAIINLDLSIVWSLFYRFSQAFPGPFGDFFERGRKIYFVYLVVHLFCYLSVLIPTRLGQVQGEDATRDQILAENPDLVALAEAPLLCFANSENSRRFQLFLSILFSVFFVIGIAMLTILVRRTMRTKRESAVQSTYRLQIMLVRALSCQMGVGMVCLLIPVVVQGFLIYNQVPATGKIASVIFALMSFHGMLDYCTMIYFIPPWRRVVVGWLPHKTQTNVSIVAPTSGTLTRVTLRTEG